jgi:hypothetical protein
VTTVDDRTATAAADPALETFLCGVWQDLLGANGAGGDLAESDFFALGGHSFLAIEVISQIQATFNLEVPFWLIFECPTPRLLAERVAQECH